jgi:hypothetical protein
MAGDAEDLSSTCGLCLHHVHLATDTLQRDYNRRRLLCTCEMIYLHHSRGGDCGYTAGRGTGVAAIAMGEILEQEKKRISGDAEVGGAEFGVVTQMVSPGKLRGARLMRR